MERPRRSGVKSIYARGGEGLEKEKVEEEDEELGDEEKKDNTTHDTPAPRTRGRPAAPRLDREDGVATRTSTSPQKDAKRKAADLSSPASTPSKRGRPPKRRPGEKIKTTSPSSSPVRPAPSIVARDGSLEGEDELEEMIIESTTVTEIAKMPTEEEEDDEGLEEAPPSLEMCSATNQPFAKGNRPLLSGALARRGRPINSRSRNYTPAAVMPQRTVVTSREKPDEDLEMEEMMSASQDSMLAHHRDTSRYVYNPDVVNDFHEPDMIVTELGDKFLKVRDGCLHSLLKRESILTLTVNETDRAEHNDWVNQHTPAIPPLTANVATYVCFVDTKHIDDPKFLTTDGLSPWSSSHPMPEANMTPTRPKVRKWAIYMRGGEYCVSGEDWRTSLYVLVEYSALLPRAPRLRKRVYYMMRDRTLLGLAMLVYDYIEPGPVPTVVAHAGSSRLYARQRLELVKFTDEEGNRSTMGIPVPLDRPRLPSALLDPSDIYDEDFDNIDTTDFLDGYCGGFEYDPEHGPFHGDLVQSSWRIPDNFVKVAKTNWTGDKTLLLRYLINETESIPPFAINNTKPALPPLIGGLGCFATFLKGSTVINQSALNTDALSPWTNSSIRPKTRKHALEINERGEYVVVKKDWRHSNVVLVETLTTLARMPRLRKRVYYVMRNHLTILGYVCFIYEYTLEGEIPEIVSMPNMMPYRRSHTMVRQRPINFYDGSILDKTQKLEGGLDGLEDAHVDVMDVGEEVEVDLLEEETELDDLDIMEEDDTIDDDDYVQSTGGEDDPNSDVVFESAQRATALGDKYVVARTRRLIADKNLLLKYIVNEAEYAKSRGLVLQGKPFMPPLCSQTGIFVFFVDSINLDLRQANKDGLSPWSSNESAADPMSRPMRTKVKKYALMKDPIPRSNKDGLPEETFELRVDPNSRDWRRAEYILVQMHSALPRCPRLQKKIFYVMDNQNQTVVGHVMIVYEYIEPGEAPRTHEQTRRRPRNALGRKGLNDDTDLGYDMESIVDDDPDLDKECPFDLQAMGTGRDGTVFVPLIDPSFLLNRDKQLHFCVNKSYAVQNHGLLNNTVPLFPPLTTDKGDFVYFVAGTDMDPRNLTCDGLAPWSDSRMPQATRPKSRKLPVEKSRDGILRYVGGTRWEHTPYFLVVYYAVLPRCPRLKKRILYVCNQMNEIIGNILIIYSFTEEGSIPQQVPHGNATSVMQPFYRMPPSLRDEAKRLLLERRPGDVANVLTERSPSVSSRAIYNIAKSMRGPRTKFTARRPYEMEVSGDWTMDDEGSGRFLPYRGNRPPMPGEGGTPVSGVHKAPIRLSSAAEGILRGKRDYEYYEEPGEPFIDVVADASIEVGGSEEISSSPFLRKKGRQFVQPSRFHEDRRRQRILDFVQTQAGLATEEDTLDYLWKVIVDRNEKRLLENIRRDFGVEIVTNEMDPDELEVVQADGTEPTPIASLDDMIPADQLVDDPPKVIAEETIEA